MRFPLNRRRAASLVMMLALPGAALAHHGWRSDDAAKRIKATGPKQRTLNRIGEVTVEPRVTYTPAGGLRWSATFDGDAQAVAVLNDVV